MAKPALPKGWTIAADGVDSAERANEIAKQQRKMGRKARIQRYADTALSGRGYMTHRVIINRDSATIERENRRIADGWRRD